MSPTPSPSLASQSTVSMLQPSLSESACQEAALSIAQKAIYQTSTASAASHTTPNKLNTVQIFDKMRAVICRVITPSNQASGFVFSPQIVITTYHSVSRDLFEPIPESDQLRLSFARLKIESKKVNDLLRCSRAITMPKNCPPDQIQQYEDLFLDKSAALDLISLRVTHESFESIETFPLISENFTLKEGMKVYLAGFPFGQTAPTFHKGRISSVLVDSKNITTGFTIDRTIAAGNSGGPVLIEHEGTLYLAGVIVAEAADLDGEFHEIAHTLEQVAKEENIYGMQLRLDYPDGTIETVFRDQVVIKAINSLKRKSTGIGKAIDARYIYKLLNPSISLNDFEARIQTNELLVKRPESKPPVKGEFCFNKDTPKELQNLGAIKFKEEHLAGTERAVEISIPKEDNLRQTYFITPDPYTVCTNDYLNDAKTFYRNAAKKFCVSYTQRNVNPQGEKTIPDSFTFKAYSKKFQASLKDTGA